MMANPSTGQQGTSTEPNTDALWKTLDLNVGWIKHAEAKGGAILAATGVGAGVLINVTSGLHAPWGFTLLAAICGAQLIAAGAFAGIGLRPRRTMRGTAPAPSLLYFGSIAAEFPQAPDEAAFVQSLKRVTMDSGALTREIGRQIWQNAHVASTKFQFINRAMFLLLGALALLTGVSCWAAFLPGQK